MKRNSRQNGFATLILLTGAVIVIVILVAISFFVLRNKNFQPRKDTAKETSAISPNEIKQNQQAINDFHKPSTDCPTEDSTDCFDNNEADNWLDDGKP